MDQRLNSLMAKTEAVVEVIAVTGRGTEAIEVVIVEAAAAATAAIEDVVTFRWVTECLTAIDPTR